MDKYKNIIIGVLIIILIGLFIFDDNSLINNHDEELKELKFKNDSLSKENGKLRLDIIKLDDDILKLGVLIKVKEDSLNIINEKIKKLQDGKTKVGDFVDNLDIDGVDRELTEYLEGRKN